VLLGQVVHARCALVRIAPEKFALQPISVPQQQGPLLQGR